MNVTFYGTRGSQPTPGHDTVRYGGNTSCVEVRVTDGSVLALDAGTGLRRLGVELIPDIRRVDILLTHLHMDHIQGLGFFTPLFKPNFEVHLWGPGSTTADLRARLTKYMSPPLFPVRLPELPCDLHVHDVSDAPFAVPGATVRAALVCHPGATVGYRVETANASLAYLPDHEPALACNDFANAPMWCSGHDLAAGVDLLVHDAQYDEQEYAQRVGWGHSTLRHALEFAQLAGVRVLAPFHHDPAHDDDTLDGFFSAPRSDEFAVNPAREGHKLVVEDHEIRAAHGAFR
jgi:phosphoribosyl 1,2-cyclic phosphodiesterase